MKGTASLHSCPVTFEAKAMMPDGNEEYSFVSVAAFTGFTTTRGLGDER